MTKPPRKLSAVKRRLQGRPAPDVDRGIDRGPGPARPKGAAAGLPSRAELLAFIANSDGRVGKREIAAAFGIKGADRVALKALLANLGADGALDGTAKRLTVRGRVGLPALPTLIVTGRTADGDLVAEPVGWDDGEGVRPRVMIDAARAMPGDAAIGIGDRIVAKVRRRTGNGADTAADPSDLDDPSDTDASDIADDSEIIDTGDTGDGCTHVGTVIRRLPREERRAVGIFRSAEGGGGSVLPIDRKALDTWQVSRGDEARARDGDLVRYELARAARHLNPRARIVEVLGNPSDQRQISLIAVHTHGIPDDFPERVITEGEAVGPPDPATRTDLTHLPFVTIDPVDARDHDDAVHAAPDTDRANPGGFVLHVAIADVSHFVRPLSALDREAAIRGNSVYFPDRVVPMLPERISNDLCSLREGELRSVLVARMVFDADGEKRRQSIERAVIRSRAKLAYEQAQAAIDGHVDAKCADLMEPVLAPLWAAYAQLSAARDRRGPLDLDLPERRVKLDSEGRVASIHVPQRLDAHRLIEECMIQANVAAAEVLESKKSAVVYRVHDQPSKEKLRNLDDFLSTLDLRGPSPGGLKPAALNRVLQQAKSLPVPELVNEVVLRSQAQAEYNTVNIGHFGLNLARYAHFTSPIRRYADLLVHRALVRALKLGDGGLDDREVPRLAATCEAISRAERRAMAAERETIDRLIAAHLADRVGAQFEGRISGVTRSGLFVKLADTGADGFIPVSTLGAEYFEHIEGAHAIVGSRSGRGWRLGDRVTVKLLEVVPTAGALRFEMASEGSNLSLDLRRMAKGPHRSVFRPRPRPSGRR